MTSESESRLWLLWDAPFLGFLLLFAALENSYPVISYVGGLRNEGILAFRAILWLAVLTSLAGLCLIVAIIRIFAFWPRHIHSLKTLRKLQVGVIITLIVLLVLPFTKLTPPGYKTYTWGFRRYVQENVNVSSIQQWLATVDPNALIETKVDVTDWHQQRDGWPESVMQTHPDYVTLALDEDGHPTIRLTWSGGFDSVWGLTIGPETMRTPETQPTTKETLPSGQVFHNCGQYRLPVLAGAYVWHDLS